MAKPALSIIVPLYNKEQYVTEALESIINQTLKEIEIICVDDGSTDQSGRIAEEFAKRDTRISIIHKKNEGLVSARKTGILCAKAKYIGFVDADDWIDLNMFQRLYEEMERKQLDFISSGIIENEQDIKMDTLEAKVYDCEKEGKRIFETLMWNYDAGGAGIVPNTVTKLYKRSILSESCLNIDDRIRLHEDDSLVYSYVVRCKSIEILHEAYYHHRYVKNSDSLMFDELFFARQNYFYLFLKTEFGKTQFYDILLPQLDYYLAKNMIWGINYAGGLTLDAYVTAKPVFAGKKKIVVYGAGRHGQKVIDKVLESKSHELVAIIDKNSLLKEVKGFPIRSIKDIMTMEFDLLIIAIINKDIHEAVREELISLGVSEDKLCIY